MHPSGCILTLSVGKNKPKEFSNDRPQLHKSARTRPALNALLGSGELRGSRSRRLCGRSRDVLTFKAVRDGQAVRALSVAFEGRRPVSDSTVAAIASRLVNDLEGYDRDAMETFADALIGGWDFDYSAHVGAALDRLAAAKLLTR